MSTSKQLTCNSDIIRGMASTKNTMASTTAANKNKMILPHLQAHALRRVGFGLEASFTGASLVSSASLGGVSVFFGSGLSPVSPPDPFFFLCLIPDGPFSATPSNYVTYVYCRENKIRRNKRRIGMGLCKCPKRKVTNLFCYVHKVNVCENCMVEQHPRVS